MSEQRERRGNANMECAPSCPQECCCPKCPKECCACEKDEGECCGNGIWLIILIVILYLVFCNDQQGKGLFGGLF